MKTLLLLFLIAAAVSCVQQVHSKCITDQKLSLLHFKKSIVFVASYSTKLISWNSSSDCCSWMGVTCSTDGYILGLDISSERISGEIDSSSSLFRLQSLQRLNMANNDFSSSKIPSAIGNLTSLRYLNLSSAGYAGQVPTEISRLAELVILDVSSYEIPIIYQVGNRLEIKNLSMLFQNLTELEELYLDDVDLSTHGSEWCQAISSSLPNLRVLSLSGCSLSGPIHKSLAKLQSLSVIHLYQNNISAPVPEFFAKFSNLTSLRLSLCDLQGTFPKEIFQVPSLQTLDISRNLRLAGSLPEFPKNGSLQSLVVSYTNISGVMPDSIGNLKMLSRLDLSLCKFTGSIPMSISNLSELVHFDLCFNQFNGSLPSFSRSKNLAMIDLSNNDLTGHIHSTDWRNLTDLVVLNLGDNMLQENIPASLLCLSLLKRLDLSNNEFSSQIPEICNASSNSLENLVLSGNNLQGSIPLSIFNFQALWELGLSSNNLSGSFSLDSLQQLRNLSVLHLSHNSLSLSYDATNFSHYLFPQFSELGLASGKLRTFPDFLRNQSGMDILDLSNNQIHGKIPNWIWGLVLGRLNISRNFLETMEGPLLNLTTTLSFVDLHLNQLRGKIPVFSSPLIEYLDYSRNNFSSNILTDIGTYFSAATDFFSLSSNNLHGIIPESICNAPNLVVLDLSNNSFSGPVPQCFTTLSSLLVLNLRRNKITNVSTFPQNCKLRSLDLSENQLKGQFPQSLVNCNKLEVSNLESNNITDTFPCFMKNISTLRVLVLRSNNFSGPIGCPKHNGTWPFLQIIDIADNNFDGEIPGRSMSTWTAMMANKDEFNHIGFMGAYALIYYQDAVTLRSKGLVTDLVTILTMFTLIDFSCNNFHGSIPEEIGGLRSLLVLNLSHNGFTGEIPSSLSNLQEVESLDLSQNNLSGEIPPKFAKLTFLSFLNLSNNQLVGRIPSSTQFSTFPKSSFQGNKDLRGPPLTADNTARTSPPTVDESSQDSGDGVDWDIISAEIGFAFGFGIAIVSLFLCKTWRQWYYLAMYNILLQIFPQLEQRFGNHRRHVSIHRNYGRRPRR